MKQESPGFRHGECQEKYQEQQCGKFLDPNNREKIFDIIDDYLDLI